MSIENLTALTRRRTRPRQRPSDTARKDVQQCQEAGYQQAAERPLRAGDDSQNAQDEPPLADREVDDLLEPPDRRASIDARRSFHGCSERPGTLRQRVSGISDIGSRCRRLPEPLNACEVVVRHVACCLQDDEGYRYPPDIDAKAGRTDGQARIGGEFLDSIGCCVQPRAEGTEPAGCPSHLAVNAVDDQAQLKQQRTGKQPPETPTSERCRRGKPDPEGHERDRVRAPTQSDCNPGEGF